MNTVCSFYQLEVLKTEQHGASHYDGCLSGASESYSMTIIDRRTKVPPLYKGRTRISAPNGYKIRHSLRDFVSARYDMAQDYEFKEAIGRGVGLILFNG